MADSKIYSMRIRQAQESDLEPILAVVEHAFKQPNEAILVDRLIKASLDIPKLSLVAEIEGTIVGHILMSVATLDQDPKKQVIALAPLAVLPTHHNRGIGSGLCIKSLKLAEATEYGAVICLGSAQYYPRFGFETASKYGILSPFDAPDEEFMVYRLPKFNDNLTGKVCYAQPFDEV
jgi:Predicted acetyltransferase